MLLRLPDRHRQAAIEGLAKRTEKDSSRDAGFDPEVFARFARDDDPVGFAREIFGVELFAAQREALLNLIHNPKAILCSSTTWGKSFVLAIASLYRWLCVGSLPDKTGAPQGGILVLTGPNSKTVFDNGYGKILDLVRRGEARGHRFPPGRSEKSTQWPIVSGKWFIRQLCPPKSAGGHGVSETAQGRHHSNLIVSIEEARTLDAALMRALEGMATSAGNVIWGCLNPHDSQGIIHARIKSGEFLAFYYSAFSHPNVIERRDAVGDGHAISYAAVEDRVRGRCIRLRPWTEGEVLDSHRLQFVYAMPDPSWPNEHGPREDGHPGHPRAEPWIYEPRPEELHQVAGQILGVFPPASPRSMFREDKWDWAVARWTATMQPMRAPDRVGVDASGDGDDLTMVAPCWGPRARHVLESIKEAKDEPPVFGRDYPWVGSPTAVPRGDAEAEAKWIFDTFGRAPVYYIDRGYGEELIALLKHQYRCQVVGVAFGGRPNPPLPGQVFSQDARTEMAVGLQGLVNADAVALPPSSALKEEALIQELEVRDALPPTSIKDRKEKLPLMKLAAKDIIKQKIGRSPDSFDAVGLCLHAELVESRRGVLGRRSKEF